MTTVLTINYNTPEYLERLLKSFRKFYDIPFVVVDGSDKENYEKIKDFDKKYNVSIHHFDYNIHHGPGMALGITKLIKTERILLMDSDVIVHNGGWLEMMEEELKPENYGIGDIQKEHFLVQKRGANTAHIRRGVKTIKRNIITEQVWVPYLHPVLALINRNVALKYPMPTKTGAPLIEPMKAIYLQKADILQRAQWLTEDLWNHTCKYVQHNHDHKGQGTIITNAKMPNVAREEPLAIVVTTFQRPDGKTPFYLKRTLDSIFRQFYQKYKVYVIGDAYTDDEELKSIVSFYPKITCVNLEKSAERELYPFGDERLWSAGGVTAANIGVEMALKDGYKYVCHIAHDDWWEQTHLDAINRAIQTKAPLFICTLSTYGGMEAYPRMKATSEILPYKPVPAGLIASSTCIKYSDTNLRIRDCFATEGRIYPADADLWARISKELTQTGKTGFIVTKITCHHDEEGYVMKIKQ